VADGSWDASFGGEVVAGRFEPGRADPPPGSDRPWLSGWAVAAGAAAYSDRDGGRVWLQLAAGTRRLGGVLVGLAAGPVVELSEARHPRWGGQGSLWLFAGATPYVQITSVTDGEVAVDVGLRIPLPAVRW
jgi:hypothetical protein